ncbi:aspartate/glutamate racemase family protein [Variovorax sp. KK3]|uniref:aspartate/glutamate racemase family protein n=1 Tax=Variovorax sp. KK3 TaxID=1855728 RepID=UPI00097BBCB2|nr:aspartate/glutamate racemase family protein [Variovorax sp. KK3]
MKTLFLNPNSSDKITVTLRRHIDRCGGPAGQWDVAKVVDAPSIIGSAAENLEAEAVLDQSLHALTAGYDRVVMMSSVDTGYDIARRQLGNAAFGFTRSVLSQHRRLGHRLHVVTFDAGMTALYEQAFEETGHRAVINDWLVLDLTPSAVAARPEAALAGLRELCREIATSPGDGIFVVGAVGLELAATLRGEGIRSLIDPVADLLAWLSFA